MPRKKKEEIVNKTIIEEPVAEVEPIEPAPVEEKPKKKKKTPVATVNTPSLNVRPDASTNNKAIGLLHEGDTVTILQDLGEWLQIKEGYVMSKYITVK